MSSRQRSQQQSYFEMVLAGFYLKASALAYARGYSAFLGNGQRRGIL